MSESDIAAKMMAGMRAQLERDQADGKLAGLSVDELADAMAHPKAGEVIADCSPTISANAPWRWSSAATPDRPSGPRLGP